MLLSGYATVKQNILRAQRSLWITLAWVGEVTRSHRSEEKKQQGVRGDVQVEIEQAVKQESGASHESAGIERPTERIFRRTKIGQSAPN